VLTPRAFLDAIDARDQSGTVVVLFLATFKPISRVFGVPGAELAGKHIHDVMARLSPPDALVGLLSWLATGIFLPGTQRSAAASLVEALISRVESEDLEIEPGEWAELRLAVGLAEFSPGADVAEVLQEAARLAESDEARFPEEWRYPVLVADD
jgi:GGDEF domain-containing protein